MFPLQNLARKELKWQTAWCTENEEVVEQKGHKSCDSSR